MRGRPGHQALLFSVLMALSAHFAVAQRTTVFPQIAVGDGWSQEVFINNQGLLEAKDLELAFFDDEFNRMELQTDQGMTDRLTFDLDPGKSFSARISRAGEVEAGYAQLSSPSAASIRATLVFRFEAEGKIVTSVGVPGQLPFLNFSFPAEVDSAAGINTGLALANSEPRFIGGTCTSTSPLFGPFREPFIVNLIGEDGLLKDQKRLRLCNGGHTSLFLDDPLLFGCLDNFRGTVSISASSPFGLLALRLEGGLLSSVAINPGPVASPFLVNENVVAEAEPNGGEGTAQPLTVSTVIEGTVQPAGDRDVFSFEGQPGEVITILVEAAVRGSRLDSYLEVVNGGRDIGIDNAQSGLLGRGSRDSFVQFGVSSQRTHFIRLEDFFFRGGSDYTYRLHFNRVAPPPDPGSSSPSSQGAK